MYLEEKLHTQKHTHPPTSVSSYMPLKVNESDDNGSMF